MAREAVYSVLPTAFSDSGGLDLPSHRNLADLLIGQGVNRTAPGGPGEPAQLNDQERVPVLETVITQVAGRVAGVAGTPADATRLLGAYSRQAKQLGLPATMVRPTRMATLTVDAVWRHYKALAEVGVAREPPTRQAVRRALTVVATKKGAEWISV